MTYQDDTEKRYENFLKEYEELCNKYQMEFDMADLWDMGVQERVVRDLKTGQIIFD